MKASKAARKLVKRSGFGLLISSLVVSLLTAVLIPKASAADFWTSCNSGLQFTDSTYVTVDTSVAGRCIITFKRGQTFSLPVGVSSIAEALVVGGGGGGGFNSLGGGGGAGQVQYRSTALSLGTATKLVITIGAGGTDGWITSTNWTLGQNGSPTEIKTQGGTTIIRAGGGAGGCGAGNYATGYEGSGGGGCHQGTITQAGSTLNATAGWNAYTNAGRAGGSGGGGGAGAAATSSQGGAGRTLFGLTVGGGGGGWSASGTGGTGGGGTAISGSYTQPGDDRRSGSDGVANTGGGGGAARDGGTGVVKIAYLIPAAKAPSAPTSVSATAEVQALTVNWSAPADLGQSTVTGYQVEHSTTGLAGSWTVASSSVAAGSTSYKITGLNGQTAYFVRVAAKYSGGLGAYGYPWTKIYETVTPYTTSNLMTYTSGFGLTGGAASTNSATAFSRIRYLMAATYDSDAKYVDANFYRALASQSSNSGTFDSISKLQVPAITGTGSQFVIQGNVSDLTVLSNTSEVQSGNGFTGRLEIWPWNYGTSSASDQAERSAGTYDDSDVPVMNSGNYGSFQLHNLTSTTKQTAFAWNGHYSSADYEIGFGNPPSGSSDWTFCDRDGICPNRSAFSLGVFINAPTTTLAGPTITSLSVITGATTGGTSTVITGTNLTGTTGVTVGGVAATLGTVTSTTVAITTPAGTVGAKDVVLTTSAGSVTSTGAFTYTRVNQATLNISASLTSANSSGTAYSATPSFSTSGGTGSGTVTYAIVAGGSAGNCTLSNGTSLAILTATTNGTCFIQASKTADNTYNVATSSNLTFTFNKIALSTATNVAATATALKTVTVTWTAASNASSYTVTLYDSTGTTVRATKTGITSPTSYTFTTSDFSFVDGSAYQVSVTSIATGDHYSNSAESSKVSVTTSTALATPTSVTASPTGTAPTGTLKSIELSWGAVSNTSSYTVKIYSASTGGTAVATINSISSSATSTTITTSPSQFPGMADKTTYYISVTAVGNGSTYLTSTESSRAAVTTHAVASELSISSQPASQQKTVGQSVTFSVTASATDQGTLSYVWQKNGTTIAGANLSSYTILNTTAANAGNYTVIITNTLNNSTATTLTSSIATLTMSTALAFNSRSNVTITAGTELTGSSLISVTATGGRENRSYAVTAGSLPAGLSLNGSTGVIGGTATATGTFSGIKITVTDANGATLEMTNGFSITVNSGTQLELTVVTRFGTGGSPLTLFATGGSGGGVVTYVLNPLVTQPACSLSGPNYSELSANFGVGISGSCSVIATRAGLNGFTDKASAATTIFFTAYVPVVQQTLTCPAGTVPSAPSGIGVGSCIQVLAPVSPTAGDAGAAPKITALSATSGLVGATIIITGTGFSTVTRVQFGTKSTTTFISKTATEITVAVPTGATRGRVMVVSPTGTAMAAQIFTVTAAPDTQAPGYISGSVNTSTKNEITLNFDETIDGTGVLATSFAVSVNGLNRTIDSISISGSNIILTLSSAVSAGQTVDFTYTSPNSSASVKDAAGNKTATITSTRLTNNLS
jgi:hypothetical protein